MTHKATAVASKRPASAGDLPGLREPVRAV